MATAEVKTKVCKRCGGTGRVSSPVVHCGMPGTCYNCDGRGVLRWVSAEVLTARRLVVYAEWLAQIESQAAHPKARIADAKATLAGECSDGRREVLSRLIPGWEEKLQELRVLWRSVKADMGKPVARGKWMA